MISFVQVLAVIGVLWINPAQISWMWDWDSYSNAYVESPYDGQPVCRVTFQDASQRGQGYQYIVGTCQQLLDNITNSKASQP